MDSFIKAMENAIGEKSKLCSGENNSDMYSMYGLGDIGHEVQGSLIGLFSGIVDNSSYENIEEYVKNVLYTIENNKLTAKEKVIFYVDLIVLAFQIRNIRNNGKGRRDQFHYIYLCLLKKFPKEMTMLLPEIKEHGYWKDYNKYLEMYYTGKMDSLGEIGVNLINQIYKLYIDQITEDRIIYDGWCWKGKKGKCELSLATKYVPKEGRSLDRKYGVTKKLVKQMFSAINDKQKAMRLFRKYYSPLQDALKTTEKLECAGRWDDIDFRFVPGKALFKKKKAYLYETLKGNLLRGKDERRLKCRENLQEHLSKAAKGGVKVHGKTMYLHELGSYVYNNWGNLSIGDRDIINAQYNDHYQHFKKLIKEKGLEIDKGLVMPDVSGSMDGNPMAAAIAISILVSDLSTGFWRNKAISFESDPHWLSFIYPKSEHEHKLIWNKHRKDGYYGSSFNTLSSHPFGIWDPNRAGGELTFCEKVAYVYNSPWGGSTDFLSVHNMILDIAVKNKLKPEELPKWFICVSDMQFNAAANKKGNHNYLCKLLELNNWESVERKYLGYNSSRYSYKKYTKKTFEYEDHHNILVEAYKLAGIKACGKEYKIGNILYWNMRDTNKFVTKANTSDVQMIGGFSTMQLKIFLETMNLEKSPNKSITPWDTLQTTIKNECYDDIRKALYGFGKDNPESIFYHYELPPHLLKHIELVENKELSVDEDCWHCGNTFDKLSKAKKLLDNNLIDINDYNKIKKTLIRKLYK